MAFPEDKSIEGGPARQRVFIALFFSYCVRSHLEEFQRVRLQYISAPIS